MGTMHKASMKSERLQKLLSFLRGRRFDGATTMEIILGCGTVAPATDVSELRNNGIDVRCKKDCESDNGRIVHRYYLAEFEKKPQAEMFAKPVWGVER